MLHMFFRNYIQIDFLSKYYWWYSKSKFFSNNWLQLKFFILLRNIKKDKDKRIINAFKFLELLTGSKSWFWKLAFYKKKNIKKSVENNKKGLELLIIAIPLKYNIYNLLNFINYYYFYFYKTFISRKWKYKTKGIINFIILKSLNKFFLKIKKFKIKDRLIVTLNINLKMKIYNYNEQNTFFLQF